MSRLVVVSNRLPARGKGVAAGGLAVALEAALKDRGGLWLGWSGRTAETPGPVALSQAGEVTFAALDLTPAEVKGYYEGISNSVLWPRTRRTKASAFPSGEGTGRTAPPGPVTNGSIVPSERSRRWIV